MTLIETKKCSKCGKDKPISCYHQTKRKYLDPITLQEIVYSYPRADCSECRSKQRKKYYKENGK